ncbi:unnamed protein product [Anisakis simplex]|uniref:Solute carrier family 25 member 46 (inferred by orthology to a human protein) n=1 Tax=Anisakis simplex TaxID=6269 RepID=A0A0M3JYP1_ANISI|nr:unnamed protein product [Anisakis simplex]
MRGPIRQSSEFFIMSSYLIRNAQQSQPQPSPTSSQLRFADQPSTNNMNASPFGAISSGGAPTTWNTDLYRDYAASSHPFGSGSSGFPSASTSEAFEYSTAGSKPQDPVASAFIGLSDVTTKMLITHPCTVLRRQCQVHQFARCLHLTPFTFAPVICNVVTGEGMLTLWKGAIGCGVLWAMSAATEILIADVFGLPSGTYFAMTPFFVSSFIETVRSEDGLGGDDIRVMDVITNAINRLRFDLFGPRDNSKRFALMHLAVPTVIYHTCHYLITNVTYDWIYLMARRYVNRKASNERTAFHQYLPHMFATMTSQVIADLLCYPFETVLHRLYIQGTRTLIDNLDNGTSAISITAKYSGFFDCTRSIVNREGLWALYSGVGALAIQYMLHFSFLRLLRWLFDYGTHALSASTRVNINEPSSFVQTSVPSSGYANISKQPSPTGALPSSISMPSTQSPKPSPYPTFGQTAASAFGRSSPPLIGSPPSASALADYPFGPLLMPGDQAVSNPDDIFSSMHVKREI